MRLSLILLFLQLWENVEVSLSQNECSTLPDVPHGYISEDTKKNQYEEGHVIHFTCETGYISGPTIRYVCGRDGWFPIFRGKCYLKPCQLPDDTPNGQYHIIHGEDFVFGATVKYFCDEGYQMVSEEDTRTCYLDKWSNSVPICQPLSCDPPPAGGTIKVEGLPENNNPILPDHFIKFSCDDPGKRLTGSSVLTCGKDGQWNEQFPSCEDITCKVDAMHPHLHIAGDASQPENKTVKTGHALSFFCDDGYERDGPEIIQCLETGEWNAPFPTCSDQCTVSRVPDNVRVRRYVEGEQVRKGEKLSFYCRLRGHTLRGKEEVECLANGQWSDPFPTCGAPLGCGKPPFLADGDIKTRTRFQYNHNERVEYICPQYYIMEGGPHKTCNNGEWTGEIKCLKPCTVDRELMDAHNVVFMYKDDDKLYSAHGDHITFMCSRGRRHDGKQGMRQQCIDGVMNLPTCR